MAVVSHETNEHITDGEVVWSWRPWAGAKLAERSADDGDNKAWSPGRARISRNTIAQGMPAAPAEPVVLPRAFLLHADHGCSPHPAFPAPLCPESLAECANGRLRAARCWN